MDTMQVAALFLQLGSAVGHSLERAAARRSL
jgi:hypothetical protein